MEALIWDVPTARSMDNMIVAKCECDWSFSRDYALDNTKSLYEVRRMLVLHMWTNHTGWMLLRQLRIIFKKHSITKRAS